jgi:Fe-S-cluster containining protein
MASRSKRLRVLHEVYDRVPAIVCKGLCWRSCAAIAVTTAELEDMERAAGRQLERIENVELGGAAAVLGTADLTCPALVMRRCAVYQARPLICRLFGTAAGLPCPHGCKPERELARDEVKALLGAVMRL